MEEGNSKKKRIEAYIRMLKKKSIQKFLVMSWILFNGNAPLRTIGLPLAV